LLEQGKLLFCEVIIKLLAGWVTTIFDFNDNPTVFFTIGFKNQLITPSSPKNKLLVHSKMEKFGQIICIYGDVQVRPHLFDERYILNLKIKNALIVPAIKAMCYLSVVSILYNRWGKAKHILVKQKFL
jgi:hypothetical protein